MTADGGELSRTTAVQNHDAVAATIEAATNKAAPFARPVEAEMPLTAVAPAQNSSVLEATRKSIDDAAAVSGGLWLSYLITLFYIGLATAGITHLDLLLENAVKMPFLNVELPLVAFFFLAPILFVIVHAYTLVHFVMLAAKVGAYDQALRAEFIDAGDQREAERRRLPSNIFVQLLAGPREIRKEGLGWLLQGVAWISLVIGPMLLLLLIQAQFLPYHLAWVTWVQRFALLADVILLWGLWPAILESRSQISWLQFWRQPVLSLVTLFPIYLAFTAATLPNEWLDDFIGKRAWIPANEITAWLGATETDPRKGSFGKPVPTSLHDLFFQGPVDNVTRRRKSVFSSSLVLPELDLLGSAKIDDEKRLAWTKHTASLRGRHLEGVVFNGADLRKVDLTGAFLTGASFKDARLEGATLNGARLEYADFFEAKLQGASLDGASLQDAEMSNANLNGASLKSADLRGADLDLAQLQGSDLSYAKLQGAYLYDTRLQGASLVGADLSGATLESASLQGADLDQATLVATNMGSTTLWRTHLWSTQRSDAIFAQGLKESPMSLAEFSELQAVITRDVPEVPREAALRRIRILDPSKVLENANRFDLREIIKNRVELSTFQTAWADLWKRLICTKNESATVFLAALLRVDRGGDPRIAEAGKSGGKLYASILAPECAASARWKEYFRAELKEIGVR